MSNTKNEVDVTIIGGGPAGLAAALTLSRGGRTSVVLDAGSPRNAAARQMHGYPGFDGVAPSEFRAIARGQIDKYRMAQFVPQRALNVTGQKDQFRIATNGGTWHSRRVLIATGLIDELPPVPGLEEIWGDRAFICPYCHGWEFRNQPWGYWPHNSEELAFGFFLLEWTMNLTVFAPTGSEIPETLHKKFRERGIQIATEPVSIEKHEDGIFVFSADQRFELAALAMRFPQRQTDLVAGLGLEMDGTFIRVDGLMETSIPGLFAAGDSTTQMQQALAAAAMGSRAGTAIHKSLAEF